MNDEHNQFSKKILFSPGFDAHLDCSVVPGVGVFPDGGATVGSHGKRNVHSIAGSGENHVERI